MELDFRSSIIAVGVSTPTSIYYFVWLDQMTILLAGSPTLQSHSVASFFWQPDELLIILFVCHSFKKYLWLYCFFDTLTFTFSYLKYLNLTILEKGGLPFIFEDDDFISRLLSCNTNCGYMHIAVDNPRSHAAPSSNAQPKSNSRSSGSSP